MTKHGFIFCVYFVLLCILLCMHVCLCRFGFKFSVLSQEHLQNDLFCIGWDLKRLPINELVMYHAAAVLYMIKILYRCGI